MKNYRDTIQFTPEAIQHLLNHDDVEIVMGRGNVFVKIKESGKSLILSSIDEGIFHANLVPTELVPELSKKKFYLWKSISGRSFFRTTDGNVYLHIMVCTKLYGNRPAKRYTVNHLRANYDQTEVEWSDRNINDGSHRLTVELNCNADVDQFIEDIKCGRADYYSASKTKRKHIKENAPDFVKMWKD